MPQATTWDQLSFEQQATVGYWLRTFRDSLGAFARALNVGQTTSNVWRANIEAILAGLPDATEIPLSDPSQGQQRLTVGQVRAAVAAMATVSNPGPAAVGSYNTPDQRWVYEVAAGLYNTIQQGR